MPRNDERGAPSSNDARRSDLPSFEAQEFAPQDAAAITRSSANIHLDSAKLSPSRSMRRVIGLASQAVLASGVTGRAVRCCPTAGSFVNSNPPRNGEPRKERKKSMKLLTASAFAVGLSLMAMSASQAMPLAPLDQSVSSDTIRVAGGCGPGWHRGPYGGCRPMFNCPPGWHSGPFGRHCFRNR